MVRPPDGPPLGTGPFRVAQWEKGRSLALAANDAYSAGRPFLDAVEVQFNRALRDQAVDFELNRADVVEIPLSEVRRYRGPQLVLSTPSVLMALVAAKPVPGLAASIDRTSIHTVLLQKQGEPAGALLPQSLSGIAFLFPASRDLDTARMQAAGSPPVGFYYDRQDPLLRAIGERIVLNASEAGITLRAASDTGAPLRLAVIRLSTANPRTVLEDLAAALDLPVPPAAGAYASERALLETNRVVPLFHLPAAYRISPRLHGWRAPSHGPSRTYGSRRSEPVHDVSHQAAARVVAERRGRRGAGHRRGLARYPPVFRAHRRRPPQGSVLQQFQRELESQGEGNRGGSAEGRRERKACCAWRSRPTAASPTSRPT